MHAPARILRTYLRTDSPTPRLLHTTNTTTDSLTCSLVTYSLCVVNCCSLHHQVGRHAYPLTTHYYLLTHHKVVERAYRRLRHRQVHLELLLARLS